MLSVQLGHRGTMADRRRWQDQFEQISENAIHESCGSKGDNSFYESGDVSLCGCIHKLPRLGKGLEKRRCCFNRELCINAATLTECSPDSCDPRVCRNQRISKQKFKKLGNISLHFSIRRVY